jgi:hypothetical protein
LEQAARVEELAQAAAGYFSEPSKAAAEKLLKESFDAAALAARGHRYERLDQIAFEVLTGVRG